MPKFYVNRRATVYRTYEVEAASEEAAEAVLTAMADPEDALIHEEESAEELEGIEEVT